MGKDKKTPVKINDKEYYVEDMTNEQRNILNHINDLDRKLNAARFNIDQLTVGRETFAAMLAKSVEATEEEAA